MARTKLIAKYSALNTEDLPERIYDKIKSHIESNGIEELPYLEVSGRWTGKIDISSGGWRGEFDFLYPVLSMCRVDRYGEVSPDMAKIQEHVKYWVEYLTTPDENDELLGVSDETFNDSNYLPDDISDFRSEAYTTEIDSFIDSGGKDPLTHDWVLSQIDEFGDGVSRKEDDNRFFEDGFHALKINSADDCRKAMEMMHSEAEENGGAMWVSPDFDMEEIEKMFEEQESGPSWMEFIDDLRNGRYGDLPEDYDGLADPDDTPDLDDTPVDPDDPDDTPSDVPDDTSTAPAK